MNFDNMKQTNTNLIPDAANSSPDYYCTWQTQLYATSDGKPVKQREIICENSLFNTEKPFGWAYFYEKVRGDLILVMDDSWDVPIKDDPSYYGSLILNEEKFPEATKGAASNAQALKNLTDKMKGLGWKGLGGWVCAQESERFLNGQSAVEYWIARLKEANESGFAYWKIDWGKRGDDFEYRKRITDLAHTYAPDLVIESALVEEIIPYSDVFRTYDVPAVMSIPMTMEKIYNILKKYTTEPGYGGLINCEDEVYIAAAGGFTIGIERHPYAGEFINGKKDMSFPDCHRNIKTKLAEITRAVKWHKIAPAFAVNCNETSFDETTLSDTWAFENYASEIEEWWLRYSPISDFMSDGKVTKTACAAIARRMPLPEVTPDQNGDIPFIIAAKNPNGAASVVTAGRTRGREYWIPRCDIQLDVGEAKIFGIFGRYQNLTMSTDFETENVQILMQDLADETAYDVTGIKKGKNNLVIPGELIEKIGTMAQDEADTSEPGLVMKIRT